MNNSLTSRNSAFVTSLVNICHAAGRLLSLLLLLLFPALAWANTHSTHYGKAVLTNATGNGTVYLSTASGSNSGQTDSSNPGTLNGTSWITWNCGGTEGNDSKSYYARGTANDGYYYAGWATSSTATSYTAYTTAWSPSKAASTTQGSPTTSTIYGFFKPVTVTSIDPTTITLSPTNPSTDYPFTVTFTTANMKGISDFNKTPETAEGNFSIAWSVDGSNVVANGKFNGGGTYGGANRSFSTPVTLASKGTGGGSQSCVVSASFPALEFVNATASDVFTTTSDATKTGSAEFNFNYGAEDDFPTTPSFTHTSGSGAFTVTGYTVTPDFSAGTCKVEVDYSFNPNNTAGPTVEELTITSVGGLVSSVTVNGTAEAEATDDAKVIAADGTTLIYQGDWATAWTKANTAANAGCTLQVLRNVSGLAANQTVTNTFTLDLNGKIVSGAYNGSLIYINKASKTLTIKDSKTGGRVENIVTTYSGTNYCVNLTAGALILESGTLYVSNSQSNYGGCGILQKAATTLTINGGKIEAHGHTSTYGIDQQSSKANSTTLTINAGELHAEGSSTVYGIRAYGKVNINGGTITSIATSQNAFGIRMMASSNATAANCYYGTLTMKGGTLNVNNLKDANSSYYAYGIYFDCANTAMGTATATDGSHANKAAAVGTIENATINVSTLGRYAYGVIAYGSYQSKNDRYDVIKIKNTRIDATAKYYYAYGVVAYGGVNATHGAIYFARMELTDCEVNATTLTYTTAYAVWAYSSSATVYKNAQPNYYGEYAGAATITINSGKYTATTKTTNAYAVVSSTRAKTTFHSDSNVAEECKLGGNAEAYPTLTIKGGEFIGNSGTTTARAVSSGGNTTITGGTFTANAGTTTAYAIYAIAGNLNVTGVEVNAEANSTAVGVYVDCAISTISGFEYYTNATLKNLNVTATTRTGAEADGVMICNYKRNLTAATLKSDSSSNKWTAANYLKYKQIYQYGDYAVGAKCTINGGTYTAKAATTTAYGVRLNGPAISADSDEDGTVAYAYGELNISNAEINAQTNGTTTCYGVWTGGPTTITKSEINATSKTTTCTGLLIEAGKTTISGSTINATGTETVRGIYVNARVAAVNSTQNVNTEFSGVAGFECVGELESTNNIVTANTTTGNTAYGIYLHAVKANTASGPFAGDHALAGIATINSGTYTATASGTTAYTIYPAAKVVQGSLTAAPVCTVNGGKFWGKATGGTDGCVSTTGQMGYLVLKGGYYNVNTNLSRYVEEGKNINDVISGTPEYTEGYRYTIGTGISGAVVCRVYQNGTTEVAAYKTLKEALQFVNANQSNTYSIVMVANHTLPKGNYVLPTKATLVVPSSLTQKKAYGDTPEREAVSTPAPVQFLMLTLDRGVNMTVYGGIETTAKQNAANGGSAIAGAPHGNYGRLHLVEGSTITLESGSKFNCWGYCTGKGEITAMNGSTVREGFQLGYWRGGTATSNMLSNRNTWHAFPVTDYFVQNVEAPILFRPGSQLLGYSAVNVSIVGIQAANNVQLLGSSSGMFLMEAADASEDTWVRKEYDASTDRSIWTVNSGAKLGQFSFSLSGSTVNSADYYLPVSNNMTILINEGEFTVTQDAMLIPGAQIIISKLGKLTVSSGKRLFVMDNEDWPGFMNAGATATSRWYYNATYSPSWTSNPRTALYPPTTTPLPDAEIFVHGTTEGQYYTTEHGANIHSTNEDAGVVRFVANAGAATSIQHVVNTNCSTKTISFESAKLKNEVVATPYTSTAGTVAGDAYTYMEQMWVNVRENGCLLDRTDGTGTHHLAHPSDVVAVVANTNDQAYHSETGSRNFVYAEKSVNTAGCVWWEAEKVTTGTYAGDYMANQEQFDNYGAYYYYDSGSGYWKPRYVTITWKNYDGTTLATYTNVMYNTSPHYSGASPKVPANSSTATYAWTGWDGPNGTFYSKDEVLPVALGDSVYTAHIQETKYQYLITFKNDDNTIIHTELVDAGEIPVCPPEKLVKNPTTSQEFTFDHWNTTIVAVTGPAEYTAIYSASPRKYTVTFVDYDMTFLADTLINYNDYAVYPVLADEPYRESTDAYSYEWIGWTKALARVTKDATYVAKYKQTTIKYRVVFKSDCWGQNDGDPGCEEKIHRSTDYALGANPTVPANPSRPATAQYTYTFDHWDPAVGPVEVGGATYTAVYTKTPRSYAITYKDKNNAAFTGTHGANYPTSHTYGTATPLVNPTRTGYDFEGWYSVADCSSGKITAIPADVAAAYTVYANWTPKTNTAYTVKHFKQNIDGTYNSTPDDTDNLTGTTGDNVTPDRKTYTGFTSPAAQTKAILADGSLVIEYKYPRNSYTLRWALSGGTVTVAGTGAAVGATGTPSISVKYDDVITAPTVTRAGYTFTGWDDTPAAKMPAVATTYTAQWSPITYNITYLDENGATFTGTHASGYPTTHTYGTATTLDTPTREGYTFGGYYTTSDCSGSKLTSLAAAGYTADITLYAKWTANTYNITYKNKDNVTFNGTHETGYPTTHTYGTATTLDSPTRTGYTFGGWFAESDCSGSPLTELSATGYTAAITLYALWNPITYNITYLDQNGAAFSGTHGENYPTTHTYGTTTTLVNPTREGYTFGGWYLAIDCSGTKLTSLAAAGYTDDITLYAKWTVKTHRLAWNWDGGSTSSTTYTAANNAIAYGTPIIYPANETMSKTGYVFSGWSSSYATMPDDNLTITAIWAPSTTTPYVVKHYLQNVTGSGYTLVDADTQNLTGTTGAEVTPAVNTYTGFNSPAAQTVTILANGSLVVEYRYDRKTFEIKFVNYDNTELKSETLRYGSTVTPPANPSKPQDDDYTYTFSGWSPAVSIVEEATTYTAQFDAVWREFGDKLDIVDWTSEYVLLNMNGYTSPASQANWTVTYNGTNYTKANRDDKSVNAGDRTMKVAVSGLEPDSKIVILGKDNAGNTESHYQYTVPHIYNASATLSGTTDNSVIFVHSGATLTVNANATVKEIYVAPGAELKINSDVTLTVNKLVLRTQAFTPSVLTDNGTLNCSNLFYSRIVATKNSAYEIGFPFNIDLTKTKFSNGKTAVHGSHYALMEYDSQARAENGLGGNWNIATGNTMNKNQGYNLISTSAYYYEIMFPVSASEYASRETDNAEVSVTNYSGEAKVYDQGWNFITSPYTNIYSTELSSEPEDVILISVLSRDNTTYNQMPLETMKPATPFYYQTVEGESYLVFKNGSLSRRAPRRVEGNCASVKTQWIRLWYGNQTGLAAGLSSETFDQTSIYLHPTKYTAEYERGFDVVKMSKTASVPRIYSSLECGDLAFAAIPDQMAEQEIPITVYNPTSGTMVFTLDNGHSMERLDHVYLIDVLEGTQTDLLFDDYQYQAAAGTLEGRFFIRTVINPAAQGTISTDVEQTGLNLWSAHANNRSIIIEGIRNKDINCYNSLGQLIHVVKASDATRAEFRVGVDGVYILRSAEKVEKIVVK